MKILLTGTRSPVTPDLVRAFASCGHDVHAADSLRFDSGARGLAGKGLAGFTLLTAPNTDFDRFASDAEALVDRLRPDLIIPLCEDIFHWTRLAARLAKGRDWPLFAPSLDLIMRLHSKQAFIDMAGGLGLNVPQTQRLVRDEVGKDGTSFVFKPEYSRFGEEALVRPHQTPALRPTDNPWVKQAWIDGEDLSFHVLAVQGQMTAFSAYTSHWRTRGGASYSFDPVDETVATELEAMARRLVTGLKLHGQFGCDLRRDLNGRYWLIECNPRATSGLHLLAHDPEALSAAFVSADAPLLKMSNRSACFGPAMCLFGLPSAVMSGRLQVWWQDLSRARDVTKGQRLAVLSDSLRIMLRGLLGGQSLAAALTADIECNRDVLCP